MSRPEQHPSANLPPRWAAPEAIPELYQRDALVRLDGVFLSWLEQQDAALLARLSTARAMPEQLSAPAESQLLMALAPVLERFLAGAFGIEAELAALAARHHAHGSLFHVKRQFVQRKALNAYHLQEASGFDGEPLRQRLEALIAPDFSEIQFAEAVTRWQTADGDHAQALDTALRYAAWATQTPEGKRRHRAGVLFKAPSKLDFMRLVPVHTDASSGYPQHRMEERLIHDRHGFHLLDQGTDLTGALDECNYCIWCHEQGTDSCSRGLREKKPKEGAPPFKKNALGITLAGCPLEEKISEFQKLKAEACPIGALAVILVDNPMVAATGHRICNDCMKSCIYQKQEPVNIPQAETRTLKDVLELPWGFELYSLLTRWNPLDLRRPYPRPPTGKRVLIVGMGPAGFTLAHHLMNDGHTVVAVDGLKIEPLAPCVSGIDASGARLPFEPVRDVTSLYEPLESRVMAGFGGVAEYGITVRWDKNFLKLTRLLLERRPEFALIGGVRFGGTLTADQAFEMGFDHVALCAGAGRPTVLNLPNGLARGVRTASDFLMGLQLTGAAKEDSLANLQLRLPVVVVGGGLTAIDTATEALAYYPLQVEKFLRRHERLFARQSAASLRAGWSADEVAVADEFIGHALALREEHARARQEGREADVLGLLRQWGGVTIAYRRTLVESPSYTLNHEEVDKALEQGVVFAENLSPVAVEVDEFGGACAVRFRPSRKSEAASSPDEYVLPARTVLVAAGTQPNTVLAREDPHNFKLDGRYFRAVNEEGRPVTPEPALSKPKSAHVLMSRRADGRFVSFFGDLHPSYFGNVVKAMGGAKQGYPVVSGVLSRVMPASNAAPEAFLQQVNEELRASVHEVIRLTPTIVEVIARAPQAARNFSPGQFYRLQNFETLAGKVDDTRLAMEGIALTGAWVDKERGLVSTIVLEMGGSSDLCRLLRPGEPIVLMGPTGTPTEIPEGETVALVGGGLGNAVLFSIGKACRERGSRVLYFAGYKKMLDRYKVEDIEAAADVVVWCSDEPPGFVPGRPGDKRFVGNIVQAMKAYGSGELGAQPIALIDADRIVAIGSDRMMAAVAAARHGVLKPYLKEAHAAIGSINSPMQCMMKEICAQCLQQHVDPATGEKRYVFSCFNQDQPLDCVDFGALNARLHQNSVQEKLTKAWLGHILRELA
jgi:NADPH-dependent glutamate synthase beta subunit-like oxidoreductase/NAD(P)H-flavin reductase